MQDPFNDNDFDFFQSNQEQNGQYLNSDRYELDFNDDPFQDDKQEFSDQENEDFGTAEDLQLQHNFGTQQIFHSNDDFYCQGYPNNQNLFDQDDDLDMEKANFLETRSAFEDRDFQRFDNQNDDDCHNLNDGCGRNNEEMDYGLDSTFHTFYPDALANRTLLPLENEMQQDMLFDDSIFVKEQFCQDTMLIKSIPQARLDQMDEISSFEDTHFKANKYQTAAKNKNVKFDPQVQQIEFTEIGRVTRNRTRLQSQEEEKFLQTAGRRDIFARKNDIYGANGFMNSQARDQIENQMSDKGQEQSCQSLKKRFTSLKNLEEVKVSPICGHQSTESDTQSSTKSINEKERKDSLSANEIQQPQPPQTCDQLNEIDQIQQDQTSQSDKYYKKFDFFYKRTCFRLVSEYFKHLFSPYQKSWVEQRKKTCIKTLIAEFAQKYFGYIIDDLPQNFKQEFIAFLTGMVHSHRHNKKEEALITERPIDFDVIRDTMYKYSKRAQEKFFKEPILCFFFVWFIQSKDGVDSTLSKFTDKGQEYLDRLKTELAELNQEALQSLTSRVQDSKCETLLRFLGLKKRDKLTVSYQRRVEKFLLDMEEKPVIINNFKHQDYQFRELKSDHLLGPKVISPNRWQSEKQRIQENADKNKILFTEAYNDKTKHFTFRERQQDKEIQPGMKFTAKNTLEQVADTLMNSIMVGGMSSKENFHSNLKNSGTNFHQNLGESETKKHQNNLTQHKDQSYGGLFSNYFGRMGSLPNLKPEQKQIHIDQNKLTNRGESPLKSEMRNNFNQAKSKKVLQNSAQKFFSAVSPKELRSDLHIKTHFKGAMSMRVLKIQDSKPQNQIQQNIQQNFGFQTQRESKATNIFKISKPAMNDFSNPILMKRDQTQLKMNSSNLQSAQQVLKDFKSIYQPQQNSEYNHQKLNIIKLNEIPLQQQNQAAPLKKQTSNLGISQFRKSLNDFSSIVDIDENDNNLGNTSLSKFRNREHNSIHNQSSHKNVNDNLMELSRNVLTNCHVIPQIKGGSGIFLKKGQGKQLSKNQQNYEEINFGSAVSPINRTNEMNNLTKGNVSFTRLLNTSNI
eukprot:403335920